MSRAMAHERQVDYNEKSKAKKREAGLVRVETWVPAEDRQKLLDYAAKLRKAAEKKK